MLSGFEVVPINCIWKEPNELIEEIQSLFDDSEKRHWVFAKGLLDLKNIYFPAPPTGGAHLERFMVWQPSNMSFGAVLVPNYRDAHVQLMRQLNRSYKTRYFSAFLARDYRSEGFCSFEHVSESGRERVVHVILEPRWKFFEQGEVLSFENPEYYKRRIIRERLTPEIVEEYLKRLGWDLGDAAFWQSKGQAWIGKQISFPGE